MPAAWAGGQRFSLLIDIYLLGMDLEDMYFRDAVTDAMVACLSSPKDENSIHPSLQDRFRLYNNTHKSCLARQVLAYNFARGSENTEKADHKDFIWNVKVRRYNAGRSDLTTLEAAADCRFHEHIPGDCHREKWLEAVDTPVSDNENL